MRAAKALASLFNLISLISFSHRYAGSERACESAHLHSLSLRNSTLTSCAGSNGDLCSIYANSEGSGESAQFDFSDKLFPPIKMKARMLMTIFRDLSFFSRTKMPKRFCDIKNSGDFVISQNKICNFTK